jgi:hypothetical protein
VKKSMSKQSSRKELRKLISSSLNILIGTGILFLFLFLILWWERTISENNFRLIFTVQNLWILVFIWYIAVIHKKRHLSGDFITKNHKKILNEFQFTFIFIMGIIIVIYPLLFLPLFVAGLDSLNFFLPLSTFITWFYLIEGIFCCILAIIMHHKKRNL